ncbi:hypothetical protein BHE74_00012996 [Ensete ventricosum]|nr:hypothetical protein GW17_00001294 [Ensete ventricosum]RWW78764.1 hypothetical protein BHE74_00012996 [Ensete ventricosum]
MILRISPPILVGRHVGAAAQRRSARDGQPRKEAAEGEMLRLLARRLMSNVPENTVYSGPKPQSPGRRVTLTHLRQKHRRGEPITVVTAYDYPSAAHVDSSGVDVLLVGDSAAMVVHGHDTTLPISLDDMLAHCRAVARGASRSLLVGDLPFGSYESSASEVHLLSLPKCKNS